jgi:predicted ATPase/DNA-binding XRE family transcriptional regulator
MATQERNSFATLLKHYRIANGLTQEGLAARARLSREAVSALERGGRLFPRADTVELLAAALELGDADRAALEHAAVRPGRARQTLDEISVVEPSSVRLNLRVPTAPTRLLGREVELDQACRLITEEGVRLLTLSGPPGVGKTRLALEVAARVAARFEDGLAFVPLASLSAKGLLADTLLRALGASTRGDARPLEMLIAYLGDKHFLLVLDNFEHLLPVAPVLTDLLASCPRLTLLVTSRGILKLRGERALPLSPLPLPDAASGVSAVAESPAVALFVSSAQAVRPEFELTPRNVAEVIAICRQLDGLPLALELAAARIRLLPPRALLARLERRLPILTGGASDLPERHRALRAALAWSYELLSSDEQLVFRRLSVFSGGATLDAAAAVCTPELAEPVDLLDWLARLTDHGLVLPPEDSASGEPRFGMLETMCEYGLEQLELAGEALAVQRAHAAYFVELAKAADPALRGLNAARWMTRLDEEVDNLRAALAWSRDHFDEASEVGLQLCGALGWYWLLGGRLREGRTWCEAILARAGGRGDAASRGLALQATARLARAQGDIEVASTNVEAAVRTFRSLGQAQLLAGALTLLSRVRVYQGDPQAALTVIAEIRQLLPEPHDEAERMRHVRLGFYEGRALAAKGDLDAARSCYEVHLAMLGGQRLRFLLLSALGDLAFAMGDESSADALLRQALPGMQADYAASQWDLALLMVNLGFSKLRHGDPEDAAQLLTDSLRKWLDQGVRAGIGLAMRGLGGVAAARGDAHRAGLLCGGSTQWMSVSDAFLLEARGAAAAAERCLADARARSNLAAFDLGWTTGVSLPGPDSINLALQTSGLRR